jgi:hypothetical protein
MTKTVPLVALTLLLLASSARAEQPASYDAQLASYSTFLEGLQRAVRTGDRAAVLDLVRAPLRVNHPDGSTSISYGTIEAVGANFDIIFDKPTIKAILQQSPRAIFSRDIGAMVGNGEVWFDYTCLDQECAEVGPIRIYAINHM